MFTRTFKVIEGGVRSSRENAPESVRDLTKVWAPSSPIRKPRAEDEQKRKKSEDRRVSRSFCRGKSVMDESAPK